MANNLKHIHKYRRTTLGRSTIYKCVLPGCTHFIQRALVDGKISLCWRCPNPFVITKKTLKNCPAKPHCEDCYQRRSEEAMLDAAIEELIK